MMKSLRDDVLNGKTFLYILQLQSGSFMLQVLKEAFSFKPSLACVPARIRVAMTAGGQRGGGTSAGGQRQDDQGVMDMQLVCG